MPPVPPEPQIADPQEPRLTAFAALMQGLIDYAGLYPPAKLDMAEATRNYAQYLRSEQSWMLGRFICPVSRLQELRRVGGEHFPRGSGARPNGTHRAGDMADDPGAFHASEPWPISAIIDGDVDENLDAIFAFNREHSRPQAGLAIIDAVEIKVLTEGSGPVGTDFIDSTLDLMAEEVYPFFEIPVLPESADLRGLIAALSGADAGAKIRTGGVTPDAFPGAKRVAEFIVACAAADVPFKATAGLHHPVRADYPLTYEPNCPRAVMHGFLNVFVAAAAAKTQRADAAAIAEVLAETDPRAFVFKELGIFWRGKELSAEQVGLTRETFALSYGSCSFTEPCDDLKKLGLGLPE